MLINPFLLSEPLLELLDVLREKELSGKLEIEEDSSQDPSSHQEEHYTIPGERFVTKNTELCGLANLLCLLT